MLLRTCFALFVVAGAWAQQARPANPTQNRNAPLTRSSFSAKGLNHEDDLTDLFDGNFADVTFDRGSLVFSQFFQMYLEAYSRRCGAYLPANKVEMTTQVCDEPPAPYHPPGEPEPLPHTCSVYRTVSLGYADPNLYAAKRQLDAQQAGNQLKDAVGSITNPMRPAVGIAEVKADADALVRINACDGAGLRRFQDNLALFSLGKQPLLLPGEPPPVAPSTLSAGDLSDSDYNRLLEDLLADQAKTWAFNRYVPGSTSQMIVAHDPHGRPAMIRAKYFFTSPMTSGRTQGSVNVSFVDGMPNCIYFSDAPSRCQQPDRRIIAKYSHGGYLDSPPGSSPSRDAAGRFTHFVDGCNAFYNDPAYAKFSMSDSAGWCRCLSEHYRNVMTSEEEIKYANDFKKLFHDGIAQPWGYGTSKSDPAWPRLHPAVDQCVR